MSNQLKCIAISDNAEVSVCNSKDKEDALLILTPSEAKEFLVQLTKAMREANII
jgi:hypothetical protein